MPHSGQTERIAAHFIRADLLGRAITLQFVFRVKDTAFELM